MKINENKLLSKLNEFTGKISELVNFLAQIEWSFTYGVFQGTLEDCERAVSVLGNEDQGKLHVKSSVLSGSQKTILSWYRDENLVKFRVLEVTMPE